MVLEAEILQDRAILARRQRDERGDHPNLCHASILVCSESRSILGWHRERCQDLQSQVSGKWHELSQEALEKVSPISCVLSRSSRRRPVFGVRVGEMEAGEGKLLYLDHFCSSPTLSSPTFCYRGIESKTTEKLDPVFLLFPIPPIPV